MEFDDDDLSFELEEETEKPKTDDKPKRRRVEGFYEEFTETEEDGKIVRRGKRSSYDHHDWRWKETKHEQRTRNIFWFALGFFAFAMFRALIILG